MNKHFKLILFDLDGTLLNTYEGIADSYDYAAEKMQMQRPSDEMLSTVIGAPLKEVFLRKYGLDERRADEAVKHYRQYYKEKGQYEAALYEGIEEVLQTLKIREIPLGVATLKKEEFARNMLDTCGLLQYFDCVMGMNSGDTMTKSGLINKCIDSFSVTPADTVLIGDSHYDREGANESAISFLGVSYGFGYKKGDSPAGENILGMAETPRMILEYV